MRKVLEDLVFIGTVTEKYKLFGKDWVLKTLNSNELLEASSSTERYDSLARIGAMKITLLSRSLIEVNGIELKDINEKLELLGKLQQPLIDVLFEKYEELQKKQNDAISEMESDIKN